MKVELKPESVDEEGGCEWKVLEGGPGVGFVVIVGAPWMSGGRTFFGMNCVTPGEP